MPLRAPYKPDKEGGGRPHVSYRAASGRTEDALVVGAANPGDPASALDLRLVTRRPTETITDVPRATSVKSTNAYFHRV